MPAKKRSVAPLFMAHVVPGLEELAWEEIREQLAGVRKVATWSGFDRRASVLLFRSDQPVRQLLELRLAEDVFVVAALTRRLPRGRAGLRAISQLIGPGDGVVEALRRHAEVSTHRSRGRPTYRVVVRKAGRHTFRRIDAQRACEEALRQRFRGWRLVEENAALEFWLQLIGETAVLALRLSTAALRQRTYRAESLPAALKPTVAHALIRLSMPRTDGWLVDPMCGTGTVLAEAAAAGLAVVGGDMDPRAVLAARNNLRAVRAPGRVVRWDAGRLPLRDATVAALACNLPWGKRHGSGDLLGLYRRVLSEAQRVVRRHGRIVLLTADRRLLFGLLRRRRGLATDHQIQVLVRGSDAWIFVLRKTGC